MEKNGVLELPPEKRLSGPRRSSPPGRLGHGPHPSLRGGGGQGALTQSSGRGDEECGLERF